MAAKANEHLTRLIRRDRAESLVTQSDPALHPPLPREAPEQKEPNRLLTDTGESSEHPAHPTAVPASEAPRRHSLRDYPSAHATTERHTSAE